MQIKILLFAEARDLAASDSIILELDNTTTTTKGKLLELLGAQHPELAVILASCNIAHNQQYINEGEQLQIRTTDEVALIPPIGGG